MIQKVLRVGTSAAVTIPKKSLEELGLKIGDAVKVDINSVAKAVSIRAVKTGLDRQKKIATLALNFVNRYRNDLEKLASE
ncbi:MAG: hypothetical protein A3H71_03275 [Candidatus Sungbacteria bacterium RIFCSPLOWO2_02_FULL_48_13b]|uniref:SpoVT-AbrB domain-containing protein n=2 Tax=Candidatus Sungiibacteriota TaxID=1817917 RepID=A0A1G2LHR5_9BACT|nr:MAG: hypothetical protein A3C12_01550 [Candidatus Sungbacteria bacterium RIFCSPHIGHO2_02_FULL_49_20]OHA11044.1 MAG: hypothetical protein A3H71_03275 [Candidatus Sungbacteria bacterium RIFCSPLOWO2_02_FULL_48_13b]